MEESVQFDIKVFLITLRLSCFLKQVQDRTSSFMRYIRDNSEEADPTMKKKCKLNLLRIQRMIVKKLQVKDSENAFFLNILSFARAKPSLKTFHPVNTNYRISTTALFSRFSCSSRIRESATVATLPRGFGNCGVSRKGLPRLQYS